MYRQNNAGDIITKILRVLFYLVFILGIIFIAYTLYDAYKDQLNNPDGLDGFKLSYVLALVVLGPIVFGAGLVLGVLSLIISLINSGSYNYYSNKVNSIVMIILPIIGYAALYVMNFFLK